MAGSRIVPVGLARNQRNLAQKTPIALYWNGLTPRRVDGESLTRIRMGIRHYSPLRVLDDYSTAGSGGSLFHCSLEVIPSAMPEIMPGEQSLDSFGAELLVAPFKALHFVLSDRSHIPAYAEKG